MSDSFRESVNKMLLFSIECKADNVRGFTMWKQKFPVTKCYPQWGLNPGLWLTTNTLLSELTGHLLVMGYFHQQRRRRRWIPVQRVSLIITLYYTELFPLVQRQRWRQRWRLSLMVTVPILGMDLLPRDRSRSQFYYILIRGWESVSIPVEKPA